MILPRHDYHLALHSLLAQSLVEELRLTVQRFGFLFRVENQEGRSAATCVADGRGFLSPGIGPVATAKPRLVLAQLLSEFIGLVVSQIIPGATDGDDSAEDAGRKSEFCQRLRIKGHPRREMSAGGVAPEKKAAALPSIMLDIAKDPGDRLGHVPDLFVPGNLRLQSIIDDCNADALRSEKPANVAINVFAAHAQAFVT